MYNAQGHISYMLHYQQIPQHAHVFFFLSEVRLDPGPWHDPTRYPISQCHNGIMQVVWLGIMIMFELRHHRETACHNQPSVMTTWQTVVGGVPHLTAAHSARQDMFKVSLYSKTYHTNSCQTSRVDLCEHFLLFPRTAVRNHRRGVYSNRT